MLRTCRVAQHRFISKRLLPSGRALVWPRLRASCPSYESRCFSITRHQQRDVASETASPSTEHPTSRHCDATAFAETLPVVCPGCGGLSQTVEPEAPGYYSQKRRNVKKRKVEAEDEDAIFQQAMSRIAVSEDAAPKTLTTAIEEAVDQSSDILICDRCHDLLHQSKGTSILHPSMQSIQAIIESSPHKHNHIYHVLDAADFPLSLIPNLMSTLRLPRLRTQNRRSKREHHAHGRTADVSFIITRSDLLAPQKEQVDRMMPYLQDMLRDALGRTGKHVRLGSVRCVSAKRGWWTPQVKQEIWERGGAGWVVGKVNVGKSALFEVVFPKGRAELGVKDERLQAMLAPGAAKAEELDVDDEDSTSLLPPVQPERQYPRMPIVSALPGTTASPIRMPFGKGKGELIDLPGVQRSSLETHVRPEHVSSLVMKSRVIPEQHTLKAGQSLLLGGIIRLKPKTENTTFLAYAFTPLKEHVTGDEKAVAIQTGVYEDGTLYTGTVENIATDKAKGRIKSAGTFKLAWDVTKKRAGPLTDKAAGKQRAENLPFIVYGADILIEGVGWIELVCQVRSRRKSLISDALSAELGEASSEKEALPEVEVFTPKGKFIGIRQPMNAWLIAGQKKVARHAQRSRPRMSISMQKRKEGGGRLSHVTAT
ncbi:hypothetical protein DOTSEDRAFT_120510 [Dothistroma septosporum NZE10]|uniref:G domain-containing protein n=1 Tax=Dothistroma septosporum (strain NZE10 / CBS 128990) TaxID=675120 RepID=N1Q067_DOTSN|nr:hypothetical protein DOTSEDRAFT_120510 [Dothistroma septosporum NZE10]